VLLDGDDRIVLIGIGKMAQACLEAAELLKVDGHRPTVIDPRVIRPLDKLLVERAARAALVVTAEDGLAHGGAGQFIRSAIEDYCASVGLDRPYFSVRGLETQYIAQAIRLSFWRGQGLMARASQRPTSSNYVLAQGSEVRMLKLEQNFAQ